MSFSYTQPIRRRAPAAESNAARSPSRAGQHPNLVNDNRNYNPQEMYERTDDGARQPASARPPQPKQQTAPEGDFWKYAALAAGAFVLYNALKRDDEPRSNPGPEYAPPAPPSVIVIPPAGVSVTAQPQLLPSVAADPTKKVIDQAAFVIPQSVVPLAPVPELVETVVVETAAPKKPRERRTTQARDEKGHYLPAGTRVRAVTEGKD